jgi:glycopeptide antibiotics resistance protein
MTHLILFASAFATVFLLGFQQQNVIGKHYLSAVIVSFGIGLSQITLWRNVPDADLGQIIATLCGGPLGIVCAMWLHPKLIKQRSK